MVAIWPNLLVSYLQSNEDNFPNIDSWLSIAHPSVGGTHNYVWDGFLATWTFFSRKDWWTQDLNHSQSKGTVHATWKYCSRIFGLQKMSCKDGQGATKWAYLDRRSTTTMITSCPCEGGSPSIKSIAISVQFLSGMGRGYNGLAGEMFSPFTIEKNITFMDVSLHKRSKFFPKEISLNPLKCLLISWMSPNWALM